MKMRRIAGVEVAEVGFGCMTLSHAYGVPPSPEEGCKLLLAAYDAGVTHFDTAPLYGFGRNEELVGETLQPIRKSIFLASKCGMTGVNGKRTIDGRPETLKRTCEESLKRLRTEVIDLYYLHRIDRAVPVEDSIGAMAELVREGKVKALGLSEASADSLRRAHAVHPIAAVQSEYSLWTRNVEIAVSDACRELGAVVVAFSPMGRGFLAGAFRHPDELPQGDIRRGMPRFNPPYLEPNLTLADQLAGLAKEAGATPAQLSIAWLLAQGEHIVPIPGTTRLDHLHEDLAGADLNLSPETLARIDRIGRAVHGPRYPAGTIPEIDTEQFPDETAPGAAA